MKFGLVHRVMTDALAALGVLALVTSGQFSRAVDIAVCLALALAIGMRESWRHEASNRHVDTVLVLVLFAVQVGRAFFNASVLDLLIELAVGLQIIRVATRKGAAHDQQVIVLALLHLIAGTVVGGGLGYGLCFLGLLIVTPGALVLSHLRREVEGNYRQGARDRTGLPVDVPRILRSKRVVGRQFIAVTCLLSVPILLFTVGLFVVFPRVGLSLLLLNRPRNGRVIGFSNKVDLGQLGTLRSNPSIALRVALPNLPDPPPQRVVLHLRGTALDHYDGRTWTQSTKRSRVVAAAGDILPLGGHRPRPTGDPAMRIHLEPIEPPVVFLPPNAAGLQITPGASVAPGQGISILEGPEDERRYLAPSDRGIRYDVFLSADDRPAFPHLRPSDRDRYLQLPDDMPSRIRDLAATWSEGAATDHDKARAIEGRLRAGYGYDLTNPSGAAEHPLDDFLFDSKRGHCEYYSTAMAVLLRSQGIPTRNVTGFAGGTYNRFGEFYAVRQGDAHSWVEVYIEGRGWLTFDPTPPGDAAPQSDTEGMLATVRDFLEAISLRWNQHVLGYDLRQQVSLFEAISSRDRTSTLWRWPRWRTLLGVLGALIVVASVVWLLRRHRKKRSDAAAPSHPQSKDAAVATSLYQSLDRAMVAIGVARSPTMPPMRHALELRDREHPLGDEIVTLTRRYLDARYGGLPLSLAERREYETRVKRLRKTTEDISGQRPSLTAKDWARRLRPRPAGSNTTSAPPPR